MGNAINSMLPLVSVHMITYNHEKFISEAIDGVLMQKTTFPIELIIGEDCSIDSTRKICEEYALKYLNIIALLPSEQNLGPAKNGLRLYKHFKGKYIAYCEGDDYWIDPLKLQKQVDFLEANPEFSICFHKVKILKDDKLIDDYITREVLETTTILDLAEGNYIHTPSVMFRRNQNVIDAFESVGTLPISDYVLHMLNAKYGKIKKLHDVMGVYRIHEGGVHSYKSDIRKYVEWIVMLENMLPYFNIDVIKIFEKVKVSLLEIAMSDKLILSESEQKLLRRIAASDNDYIFNLTRDLQLLKTNNQRLIQETNSIKKNVKKILHLILKRLS